MNDQGKTDVLNIEIVSDLLDYMTSEELLGLIAEARTSIASQFQKLRSTDNHEIKLKIAHSIKGECGVIGALQLHLIFKDFEARLRSDENIPSDHDAYRFEQLFAEFHSAITTFINDGK